MTSYYRRFIDSFARIAHPLHAFTKKGASYEWTEICQEAFDGLKKKLCEAPILAYPSFTKEFVLETDASILGIGAVLSQAQIDGNLHLVAFASRALSPAERNYSVTDLETLAVLWAVSHFRIYLYGQKVTVYTDHAAVKAVLMNPSASGRHARWWTKVHGSGLQEVIIVYRAGKENAVGDALSRNPQGPDPIEGLAESEAQVSTVVRPVAEENEVDVAGLLETDPICDTLDESPSLATEQLKDDHLWTLINYMETGELPEDLKLSRKIAVQATQFTILDGVIYFLDPKRHFRKRAVVPAHLREKLIAEVHGGPLSGHFSTNRLFNTLSRTWWWEGMYKGFTVGTAHSVQWLLVQEDLDGLPLSRYRSADLSKSWEWI